LLVISLFVCLVADGWCWFVLREKYCWLIAGGWFVLREKYCWVVADKPSEQSPCFLIVFVDVLCCQNLYPESQNWKDMGFDLAANGRPGLR
jgi:hypothetical protein